MTDINHPTSTAQPDNMNWAAIARWVGHERYDIYPEGERPTFSDRQFMPDHDEFRLVPYSNVDELDDPPFLYWEHVETGQAVCGMFNVVGIFPDGMLCSATRHQPSETEGMITVLTQTGLVFFPATSDQPHAQYHTSQGTFTDWLDDIGLEVWDKDLVTDLMSSIAKMVGAQLEGVEQLNSPGTT